MGTHSLPPSRTVHVSIFGVRRHAVCLTTILGLALASACATTSSGGGGAHLQGEGETSTRDVLAAERLGASTASNLYEAIQQLRPELLSGHHLGTPDVYIGDVRQPTGLDRLKQLAVVAVAEVRYLPYAAARSLPGAQSEAGALVVTMK